MFFTPELLARRDSGFGLLWLAATLGSKSIFTKLPKKSVMTADITQLCDLITEPAQPLALRLSSNLMYGVVRVYKVKQDIFMTDVNSCVSSLRKMVQDMHQHISKDSDLFLAQPIARRGAVTIQRDPGMLHTLEHEALFSGWNEEYDIDEDATDDGEYDPKNKGKRKEKAKRVKASVIETARRDNHTLNEHHEHLLSASFDNSFEGGASFAPAGIDISSSQAGREIMFGGDFNFGFSDGFDLAGDLGDELAKELGWEINESRHDEPNLMDLDAATPFDQNLGVSDLGMIDGLVQPELENAFVASTPKVAPIDTLDKSTEGNEKEDARQRSGGALDGRLSPATSFVHAFLSQDQMDETEGQQQVDDLAGQDQKRKQTERKRKRARFLLDARTELTDEELKIARAKYLESQKELRKEMEQKKHEKDANKLVEELIFSVPRDINAEPLVHFLQNNFKVQVQARTNAIDIYRDPEPPKKRTRKAKSRHGDEVEEQENLQLDAGAHVIENNFNLDHNIEMDFQAYGDANTSGDRHRGSSEEPGQARHRSRSSSFIRASQFGIDIEPRQPIGSGSQKSSLFPWDHAGISSSAGGPIFSEQFDVGHVDTRLRSNSLSRRGSPSLRLSHNSSFLGGFSPVPGRQGSRTFGEDIIPVEDMREDVPDTQKSEVAVATLEKNSFNFLEYARMQQQANSKEELAFDTIVPNVTSTRHVAAAAFYHCLGK